LRITRLSWSKPRQDPTAHLADWPIADDEISVVTQASNNKVMQCGATHKVQKVADCCMI
jgi:hypothetical protein